MKTSSQNKRKERDIMKLLMSNYEVSIDESNKNDLYVKFHGPKNSPYENVSQKIKKLKKKKKKIFFFNIYNKLGYMENSCITPRSISI